MNTCRRGLALALFVLLIASAYGQQHQPDPRAAEVRKAIQAGNTAWGKARVAHDRATFEAMLAPDFYVQGTDRKLSRQEFIDLISTRPPNSTLTRFDPIVLTVEPKGDAWEAVILERMEFDRQAPDGRSEHLFALWITKDGWKQIDGKWQALSSSVVSVELWKDSPPPLSLW